jgi:hypothetical protein
VNPRSVRAWEAAAGVASGRRLAMLACVALAGLVALLTMAAGLARGALDPETADAAQGFVWAFLAAGLGKAAAISFERRREGSAKEE